jgi:hypothetical protein
MLKKVQANRFRSYFNWTVVISHTIFVTNGDCKSVYDVIELKKIYSELINDFKIF